MQIQPITSYRFNANQKLRTVKVSAEPTEPQSNQPNFKGLKGLLKGAATGAGVTAGGVALIAGVAALPIFLGYIAVNGAIAAAAGHFIEQQNKKD